MLELQRQAKSATKGWQGSLRLEFAAAGGHTFLARSRHCGPLQVQRPFNEKSGTCQVYILHPPGGIVGGDELHVHATLRANTTALLTAPGATKFYRSSGPRSCQRQTFTLDSGSCLEWLPQETIIFDGANALSSTEVRLSESASFMGWEITCLGRPASGETFKRGQYRQQFDIWRGNTPIWLERISLEGGGAALKEAWGLEGKPVIGTFIVTPANEAALRMGRELLPADSCSVSLVADVLVYRYLGYSTEEAKQIFAKLWAMLRPLLQNKEASPPRIWAT